MAEKEKEIKEREQYLDVTKEMMKYDTSDDKGYKDTKHKLDELPEVNVDPYALLDHYLIELRDYHTNE